MSASRTVFISAGEQSGDLHGAELARELIRGEPDLRLLGIGGSGMADAGVSLVADIDRLSVLGLVEVLRRLPDILALRRQIRRCLIDEAVDLLVLIDNPGFNLNLARFAHRHGIPVIYYIAPQVWVWHESRSKRLRKYTERVCVVLPFEEEFLTRRGVTAEFVGHPLLDRLPARSRKRATGEPGDQPHPAAPPVLGVFPASRHLELRYLLPVFLAAARKLAAEQPGLEVLIARPPDLAMAEYGPVEPAEIRPVAEVLEQATVALTKSGTINLELALRGIPLVVGYRVHPLTQRLARLVTRVDQVSLVNLIAGHTIVPEYLQDDCTSENLVAAVRPLLDSESPARSRMIEGLRSVSEQLGEPGCAARVAARCLELLDVRG